MENLDTNELIEQYLRGSLPAAEIQAVEVRMAADTAFRDKVELHRQLHEEFADAQKLQLRDILTDILKEPPPPAPMNYSWMKVSGTALAILLLGWIGWHWFSPALENTPPAVQEEIKPKSPKEPIDTPEIRNKPPEPLENAPERPIAKADPSAYIPNQVFEESLGRMIRSSDGTAELKSPAKGANFKTQNGVVNINFRGTAPADTDTSKHPLVLKIYDNQAIDKALFRISPSITNRNASKRSWRFSSNQRLRLRPGLYYFTVERQADDDLIIVGKFRVE